MITCNKNQICVLMVNSPNIPIYAHKAAINNYLYCVKYGYTFIVERCPDINDLDKDYMWDSKNEYLLVWSKPLLVKRHLHNYKYLFIIDSDAIFIDFNKSIEYLIDKYFINDDVCIIAGFDCYNESYCFTENKLNAGVMMFKNIPKTFEILNKWYDGPNNECIDWKYNHPREQECINIIKKNYENNFLIIPHYEINGIDGIFVKHYMLNSSHDRNINIDSYLQIHYKDLVKDIIPNDIPSIIPNIITNNIPSIIETYNNINNDETKYDNLTIIIIILFILIIYLFHY